jgi:hypothetical protein
VTASYRPDVTYIEKEASAVRLVLRINPLDEFGEQINERTTTQVAVEGIIGSPEGVALGSPGDIRIRQDVPQIWQKAQGIRTTTGWVLIGPGGGGGGVVALCDAVPQPLVAGSAGAAGIDADASRCDHSHPVPVDVPVTVTGGTNAEGASTSLSRADHEHRLEVLIQAAGALVGSRPTINFIGATVADDGGGDRVNIIVPGADTVDVRRLLPSSTTVAPLNLGIGNVSSGPSSYVAPTGGASLLASVELERWTIPAAGGSTAGHRNGVQIWNRDAFGGFTLRWVMHLQTLVNNGAAGYRAFVGLAAQTAVLPTVNPSTFTNIVGFGFDPAAAPQWSTMVNDAAGAATVTALGAGFVANTTSLMFFEIEADAGGSDFRMRAVDLTTGADSGVITVAANIPASTLLFSENVWLNSGGDATTQATVDVAEILVFRAPLAA